MPATNTADAALRRNLLRDDGRRTDSSKPSRAASEPFTPIRQRDGRMAQAQPPAGRSLQPRRVQVRKSAVDCRLRVGQRPKRLPSRRTLTDTPRAIPLGAPPSGLGRTSRQSQSGAQS